MALSKIKTNSLSDDAVTAAKIATGTIVAADLAANSVDSSELVDGSIDASHIASSAVTNVKTNFQPGTTFKGDGSSTDGKITLNCSQNTHGVSIQSPAHASAATYTLTLPTSNGNANEFLQTNGSGVLTFATVGTSSLAADAVDGTKLADNAVDSEHYTDGSIDNAHIADDQIDSEHYVDGSIDTAHIGNLQVTTAKIAADAIDGTKLADDAVDSEHYSDASIDTAHLADDAVGVAALAATGTASSSTFLRGDNSWASAGGANTPAFYAYISSSTTAHTTGTLTKVAFNTEVFDVGSCFDTSNNRFVVPAGEGGKYYFWGNIRWADGLTAKELSFVPYLNGSGFGWVQLHTPDYSAGWHTIFAHFTRDLNATDYVELYARHNKGSNHNIGGGNELNCNFGGFKIIE